jgi:hypothetical protein
MAGGKCVMKLIYGTTNKAKIDFMKKRIEPLGIEILSLIDVDAPNLDIDALAAEFGGSMTARYHSEKIKEPYK